MYVLYGLSFVSVSYVYFVCPVDGSVSGSPVCWKFSDICSMVVVLASAFR